MTLIPGVVFPQTEIGNDPIVLRDFAQAAETMGYKYLLAYDHVLGANPDRPGGWKGPYTFRTPFHEPFVLFSHLAALTTTLEFVTGVIILPQRQTALVAKQAAQLALLSGGRLRLGIGIGWNKVEYDSLGQDFHVRGRRSLEQVRLLRQLWQQPLVTFKGEFDSIDDAGINPLPPSRIPIWFGGEADAVLQRMATDGDGWIVNSMTTAQGAGYMAKLRDMLLAAGRDPATFGADVRINMNRQTREEWLPFLREWTTLGATHACINMMGVGITSLDGYLDVMRQYLDILQSV